MPKERPRKKASKKAEDSVPLKIVEMVKVPILASLGAMSLAQEGMEKVFGLMVEKGKITGEEGSRLMEELKQKGIKGREDLHSKIEEGLLRVMESLNLPTHDDMEEIKRKIDLLAKKIEDIKAQRKEE